MFQKNIRCLFVGRAQFAPGTFHQTRGFFRHRMSGRHPMSNFDESDLGNEISFAIILPFRGE